MNDNAKASSPRIRRKASGYPEVTEEGVRDKLRQMAMEAKRRAVAAGHKPVEPATRETYRRLCRLVPGHAFALKNFDEFEERNLHLSQSAIEVRIDYMAKEYNESLNLPTPHPSAPKHPPRFNVSFAKGDRIFYSIGFREMYAFKHLMNLMLDDREWSWTSETQIDTKDGFVIKSDHLEDVIEYKLTAKERQWTPTLPWSREWSELNHGKPTSSPTGERKKAEPVERVKRSKTPRASRDGLVPLQQIADEMKLEPKACRVALRKSKIDKPDAGWAWPASEVEAIKATIKKHAR